jgi:pyruvate dehydrogenase E1 component alpha subunit
VVEIARATRHAVSAMRDGGGPRFLELVTYRWRGHVGPREDEDVGVQRKDDLTRWKRRDPIRRLADALVPAGILEQGGLSRVTGEAKNAVEEAWGQATRDPFPPTEALLDRVYTKGPGQ